MRRLYKNKKEKPNISFSFCGEDEIRTRGIQIPTPTP
jgi:hypothetical protein